MSEDVIGHYICNECGETLTFNEVHIHHKKQELRPCPFCGKEVISYILEDFDNRKCVCQNDECVIGHYILDGKYWDVRPLEDALQAERDLLQKQLDVAMKGLENAKWVLKGSTTQEALADLYDYINNKLAEIAKFGEKK